MSKIISLRKFLENQTEEGLTAFGISLNQRDKRNFIGIDVKLSLVSSEGEIFNLNEEIKIYKHSLRVVSSINKNGGTSGTLIKGIRVREFLDEAIRLTHAKWGTESQQTVVRRNNCTFRLDTNQLHFVTQSVSTSKVPFLDNFTLVNRESDNEMWEDKLMRVNAILSEFDLLIEQHIESVCKDIENEH